MCLSPLFTYFNLWRVCPVCWFLALFNYHFQPLSTTLFLCQTFQHWPLYRCFSRPSERLPPFSPSWFDEFIHIHHRQGRVFTSSIFSSRGQRGLISSFGRGGFLVYWSWDGHEVCLEFQCYCVANGWRIAGWLGGVNRCGWEMWERSFGIFQFNPFATNNVLICSALRDCTNRLNLFSFSCN